MKSRLEKNNQLNNKGFVATAVLYSLIGILGCILIITINNLKTTRNINITTGNEIKNKLATYTINYHANGGTGTMSNSILASGKTHTLKSNSYVKSGYSFIGWHINPNSTTAIYQNEQRINNQGSKDTSVKILPVSTGQTIDLYAVWRAKA